jgi:predicted RNA-binding Zn-ribbon protein involved in translation (DUF1610 family)
MHNTCMSHGGWQNPAHLSRCKGKRRYSSMAKAEVSAEQASGSTGELIVGYECPDCGKFHIGHADKAQLLARIISRCLFASNVAKRFHGASSRKPPRIVQTWFIVRRHADARPVSSVAKLVLMNILIG